MTDLDLNTLCPGCLAAKGRANPCPHCGYDEAAPRGAFLLPHRTLLNGQFLVGRVLGKPGGFGITYLGWDLNLQTRVAIKEYLPRELAGRATDRATVAPHTQDEGEQFHYGLEQFLREARTLAQIDHPNIVRVRHFFEVNGTAYLVMDYYQGLSLAEHLERHGGRLPEEQAKQVMLPILDGLRAVHAKHFLHRDIKPQNIYLARIDSGGTRPILLDFGAARQAMGERSRSLSVVVSAGYAPFEQYHRKGNQGPWTDIYSAAAVIYRLVTGVTPPEATERRDVDLLKPAAAFGVSKPLSDALSEALSLAPEQRPQTVRGFQARLWGIGVAPQPGPAPGPAAPTPPSAPAQPPARSAASAPPKTKKTAAHSTVPATAPRRWLWPAALAAAVAVVSLGGWYHYGQIQLEGDQTSRPAGATPSGQPAVSAEPVAAQREDGAMPRTKATALAELFPSQTQAKTAIVINKVLERYHYGKANFDDAFAHGVVDSYLDALDPSRSFFLARDVESVQSGALRLNDSLRRGELDAAFDTFRVYRTRVDERVAHALALLSGNFDFNVDESYQFDRSKAPWAKSGAELDEIWRQRVKNDFLSLRIAGKSDDAIRERLSQRYRSLARRLQQFTAEDVFQSFMNAYTETLEPNTNYLSPSTSANFDISMKLSQEGIGVVLRSDNECTVIQRTLPGGPARESGQISAGDRIIGVAQGLGGKIEDVAGWRLQDVVDKLRGPKGSVVRLQVVSQAGGKEGVSREVALARNEIRLEDQAAKDYVIDDFPNAPGVKIGVIELPSFYRDFDAETRGQRDFRSSTRDVRQLLGKLSGQGIDGIVIDLRGSGGGSLAEATSLTGLFIDTGPVVQVKDTTGKVTMEEDQDPGMAFAGPLAILVDNQTAGASEILAATIQDTKRGLVVGLPTFGRGSIQTLVDLNRYVTDEKQDLGRLRLTMAMFYRMNGDSVQLRGIEPDIVFPFDSQILPRERLQANPLPWDRISPVSTLTYGFHLEPDVFNRHLERVRADRGFQLMAERNRRLAVLDTQKMVSLNLTDRQAKAMEDDGFRAEFDSMATQLKSESAGVDSGDGPDLGTLRESARILADCIKAGCFSKQGK